MAAAGDATPPAAHLRAGRAHAGGVRGGHRGAGSRAVRRPPRGRGRGQPQWERRRAGRCRCTRCSAKLLRADSTWPAPRRRSGSRLAPRRGGPSVGSSDGPPTSSSPSRRGRRSSSSPTATRRPVQRGARPSCSCWLDAVPVDAAEQRREVHLRRGPFVLTMLGETRRAQGALDDLDDQELSTAQRLVADTVRSVWVFFDSAIPPRCCRWPTPTWTCSTTSTPARRRTSSASRAPPACGPCCSAPGGAPAGTSATPPRAGRPRRARRRGRRLRPLAGLRHRHAGDARGLGGQPRTGIGARQPGTAGGRGPRAARASLDAGRPRRCRVGAP